MIGNRKPAPGWWETGALLPLNAEQEQWFEILETIPVAQITQGEPQSIDIFFIVCIQAGTTWPFRKSKGV